MFCIIGRLQEQHLPGGAMLMLTEVLNYARHFFCTLTCSPNQSLFANVTDVQIAQDTNATAVKEVLDQKLPSMAAVICVRCKQLACQIAHPRLFCADRVLCDGRFW